MTGTLSPSRLFIQCTVARNLDQLNCRAKCGSVGPLTVRGPHGMPVFECVGGGLVLVGPCLVARFVRIGSYRVLLWLSSFSLRLANAIGVGCGHEQRRS